MVYHVSFYVGCQFRLESFIGPEAETNAQQFRNECEMSGYESIHAWRA